MWFRIKLSQIWSKSDRILVYFAMRALFFLHDRPPNPDLLIQTLFILAETKLQMLLLTGILYNNETINYLIMPLVILC